MKKVRVANPGPAGLLVINPRGRKTMATKRRKTARHTTARRTSNLSTTRRKKTRRSNPTVFSSSRRRTTTRRRTARRRNPSTGGLISQAAGLAIGITAVGLAQSFVPPIGGVSPFAVAGRQAATGYGLGWAMKKFGFLTKYATDIQLAGVALGVGTLINAFLLPTISGFLRPAPRPAETGNGVQGIGVYQPGMQAFRGYRGLNGIATLAPGQQPFNDYVAVA